MRHPLLWIATLVLVLAGLGSASGQARNGDSERARDSLRVGIDVTVHLDRLDLSLRGRLSWGEQNPGPEAPLPRAATVEKAVADDVLAGQPSMFPQPLCLARGSLALLQVAGDAALGLLRVAL